MAAEKKAKEKIKDSLASLDIKVLAEELQFLATGRARLQKIYEYGKTAHVEMHVSGKGTFTLVIGAGMLFLTQHKFAYPEKPSDFAMTLRKYLENKRIVSLKQHDFDRIIIIEADDYKLIGELIPKGNVILTDSTNKILAVLEPKFWAARKLKIRENYAFPPARIDITKLTADEAKKILADEEKKIVAWLAENIGSTYAEEICSRFDVDKDTACKDLMPGEIERLLRTISEMLKAPTTPKIIISDDKAIDVVPRPLKIYRDAAFKKESFATFNEAAENYFLRILELKEKRVEQEEVAEKAAALEKIREEQEKALEKLYADRGEYNVKARLINENYILLQDLVEKAKANLKDAKKVSPKIKDVDLKEKSITVELEPTNLPAVKVKIFTELSIWDNAALYYEAAKKAKEKAARVEKVLAETVARSKKAVEAEGPKTRMPEKKTAAWYEKFRWFRSSEGFLCVSGKDAATNEILIKKHTEPHDIVFHADIAGSPFTIVKTEGKTPGDATIQEAAQFTAVYSRAWREGVGIVDVYWVKPEQVSKKAPSGEYVARGAFMIYGKKNVLKAELKLAIGVAENQIVAGPVGSITTKTKNLVIIGPGNVKAAELSKKIKATLFSAAAKEQQEWLRGMSEAEIQKFVPFGQGELVKP